LIKLRKSQLHDPLYEVGLPGPFGEDGGKKNPMAQAGGVLRLFHHLKSRDADTSFRLDSNSAPLGVVLKDIFSLIIIF
jgi:hypothetical protein